MANINAIRFIRGDTHVINLGVTDRNGNPYAPAAEDLITMTVRANDHRGDIVLQKRSGDGDVLLQAGGWKIVIQPSDTALLPYKNYVYDIELDMSGVIQTVIPLNNFVLDKEVTY